jgi:hypothetical protein
MGASQVGQIIVFDRWWTSWFGAPAPICSAEGTRGEKRAIRAELRVSYVASKAL